MRSLFLANEPMLIRIYCVRGEAVWIQLQNKEASIINRAKPWLRNLIGDD